MENYRITYRGKDGKPQTMDLEAKDRADVFRKLEENHISAIKVEQTNGKTKKLNSGKKLYSRSKSKDKKSSFLFGSISVIVIFAILVVALLMFLYPKSEQEEIVDEKKTGMIEEAIPNIPTNATDEVTEPETNSIAVAVENKNTPLKKVIRPRSSRTGMVMTMMDGTVVTNIPRAFFSRDFEKSLHVALHPGGMASGLLRNVRSKYSDDEILSMLKELTLPDPNDDETAIGVKNKVQALKEDILIAIDNGSTVSEVFDDMIKQCTSEGLLRADAFKAKIEAIRTGDPEIVRESIKQINEVLESSGLRKMDVPLQFQEPEIAIEDDADSEQGEIGMDEMSGDSKEDFDEE